MRSTQSHGKSHQRGKLMRTTHETAMNILGNALQISTSHLVARQELYAVPFPDTNHHDLELGYTAEPTRASSVLDTLTMDPDSFKVAPYKPRFLHVHNESRQVGSSMLRE